MIVPEVAATAICAYAEETNRLNRARRSNGDACRVELEKTKRELEKAVDAKGACDGSVERCYSGVINLSRDNLPLSRPTMSVAKTRLLHRHFRSLISGVGECARQTGTDGAFHAAQSWPSTSSAIAG
jgi:hypothetical protein